MKAGQNSWTTKERSDGVITSVDAFQAHENTLYSKSFHDPAQRKLILDRNKRIRTEKPLKRSSTKGNKLMLTIPQGDLPSLQIEFPDLKSTNQKDVAAAYGQVAAKYPEYLIHKAGD